MEVDEEFEGVKRVGSCIPGQRLCSSEGHKSAEGTYEHNGYIYSSFNGVIYMSCTENKLITVEVVCSKTITGQVPKKDDIVTGKVTTVDRTAVRCMIICVGEVALKRYLRGMLRLKDSGLTASNMTDFFHVGDVFIAKVLTRMEGPYYLLTTQEDDLGVITAYSENGEVMPAINWTEVQCMDTGAIQNCKLARVLSTAVSLDCVKKDGTIGEVEELEEDTGNKADNNPEKKNEIYESDTNDEDSTDDENNEEKDESDGKKDEGGEGGVGNGEGGDGDDSSRDGSDGDNRSSDGSDGDSSSDRSESHQKSSDEGDNSHNKHEFLVGEEEDFYEEEYQNCEDDAETVVHSESSSSNGSSIFYDVDSDDDSVKIVGEFNATGNNIDDNDVIIIEDSENNIAPEVVNNKVIEVIDLVGEDDDDVNEAESSGNNRNAKRCLSSSSDDESESSSDDDVKIVKHIIHVKVPKPNPRL